MTGKLTLIAVEDIPLVTPGDDVAKLIIDALDNAGENLDSGDILVIAQKIISKAEDRYVDLASVTPSNEAIALADKVDKDPRLVELILRESKEVVRFRMGVLIVEHRLGFIHANAGIDQSNIEGEDRALLLPEDPNTSARQLQKQFKQHYQANIGIIINDSSGRAWRKGITGYAIGCAGIRPLLDLIGEDDLYGRKLQVTQVAIADELASAASFLMGQSGEAIPVVLIRGAQVETSNDGANVLLRDRSEDLFR